MKIDVNKRNKIVFNYYKRIDNKKVINKKDLIWSTHQSSDWIFSHKEILLNGDNIVSDQNVDEGLNRLLFYYFNYYLLFLFIIKIKIKIKYNFC